MTTRTTKSYNSGSSVITHIIKSQERYLHLTSHLAFSHITQKDRDLSFVTSVVLSTFTATNGLISFFILSLITSSVVSNKSF